MDEDQLRAGLRGLADVEPPVTVDHADVLRAGRRRRRARATGAGAVALAVALAAYPALAGRGPDRPVPPAATPTVTADGPRALVDRETGVVTRPMDVPDLTDEDATALQTAYAHARAQCMTRKGFDWSFDGPVEPVVQPERRAPYGVWREEDVRAHGYAQDDGSVRGPLGAQESLAVGECEEELAASGLVVPFGELQALREEHGVDDVPLLSALDTDEGRDLRDQWAQCLEERGVTPPPDDDPYDMVPSGERDAPFDEQVRVGLVDVACKDRLDLVQRLADIDAGLQTEYLEQTAEYQAAVQARTEEAVEASRRYLAEHGVDVP